MTTTSKFRKRNSAATILFILVNTSYFYERWLGVWDMLLFLLLVFTYLALCISLVHSLIWAVHEKFRERRRLFSMALTLVVLLLVFIRPGGIINFRWFEAKTLLEAGREGAAGCYTSFTLRADNSFTEQSRCFGISEINGRHEQKADTFFFSAVSGGRGNAESYYVFAVIKGLIAPASITDENPPAGMQELWFYKQRGDTIGIPMTVSKVDNELAEISYGLKK